VKKSIISFIFVFIVTGCVFKVDDNGFVRQRDNTNGQADLYVKRYWLNFQTALQLHHVVLLQFKEHHLLMDGILQIDTEKKIGKVVALNNWGIKLFDLVVSEDSVHKNFVLPSITKIPSFTEHVADCIRKIFIDYHPKSGFANLLSEDRLKISSKLDNGYLECVFNVKSRNLMRKSYFVSKVIWEVFYAQYQNIGGIAVPTKIIFKDYVNNYNLTLKLTGMKIL